MTALGKLDPFHESGDALIAFSFWGKSWTTVWMMTFCLVLMTYVNMCIMDWWAGGSFSNRRFDGALPIFAFGVAASFDYLRGLVSRRPAWAAATLGHRGGGGGWSADGSGVGLAGASFGTMGARNATEEGACLHFNGKGRAPPPLVLVVGCDRIRLKLSSQSTKGR